MPKLIGPVLAVALVAALTVAENARFHGPSPVGDWFVWIAVGVAWGVFLVGGMFAVFAPLAWLARRLRGPGQSD